MPDNAPGTVDPKDVQAAKEAIATALLGLNARGVREGNTMIDLLLDVKGKLDALYEKSQAEAVKIEDLETSVRKAIDLATEAREGREAGDTPSSILARAGRSLDAFFSDAFGPGSGTDRQGGGSDGEAGEGEE